MSRHTIYVASSWRNKTQPYIVSMLRRAGHEVYDFRNPHGQKGFRWEELDPDWEAWNVFEYREALKHPVAEKHYKMDMEALAWADVVVLLLPSGRSAHVEAAWHTGRGGVTIVHSAESHCEPELMYKMFNAITTTNSELMSMLGFSLSNLESRSLTGQ